MSLVASTAIIYIIHYISFLTSVKFEIRTHDLSCPSKDYHSLVIVKDQAVKHGHAQYVYHDTGWGLLSLSPLLCYFPNSAALWINELAIEYHVHILQVSPELNHGGTC